MENIKTTYREIQSKNGEVAQKDLIRYINLQLAAMGQPIFNEEDDELSDAKFIALTDSLIQNYRVKSRLLADHHCPSDQRIQNFLNEYFKELNQEVPQLPTSTFTLDQEGIARELSLPPHKNEYITDYLSSYRIKQGVLHNPKHDRRTTKGSFHIVEGNLPAPLDKIELPKYAFLKFLDSAFNPSDKFKTLPFTATQDEKAKMMVSLLLRPVVCPEVKGVISQKSMEVRFFVPGAFVSNLDFVESIFGNAGDPHLPSNDAGLDIEHWTGHTGCVVLAPQLLELTKKELGLPHYDKATERQRNDGVCWKEENELYNGGQPFKVTCRSEEGVVITLIADNYFGYSKKEIKTQISFSANLYGLAEEEHSGGAIAFPRKNLGDNFDGTLFMNNILKKQYVFDEVMKQLGDTVDVKSEGYAVDKEYENIIYIDGHAKIDLYKSTVSWVKDGQDQTIRLMPGHYYVHPSGYKLHMEKHPSAPSWRLVSTYAEGTFCHKPCTVSGGGKSEISKSLLNAIIYSSFYIQDMDNDFDMADEVFNYDYSNRWKDHSDRSQPSRPLLNSKRSLGSVVKLLTPSKYYTEEYNNYLQSIPDHVKGLVLFIKRFYREGRTGRDWRNYFSVDMVNGKKGHELLYNNRKIVASYLRVGFATDNSWFLHKLRQDFIASAKIQMEDDITASVVLPTSSLSYLNEAYDNKSVKITTNCERRFFQRPDEAVHRGYDKEAEADLSMRGNFTSNYEPMTTEDGQELMADAIGFDLYTKPIQDLIRKGANSEKGNYFITPSHTRIVNGAPSQNPRYLQIRPDLVNPIDDKLAEVGVRLARKIPMDQPVHHPVNAVLPGRRNNPADKKAGIRALSVYNPIHYQELPELFMDFICSLTGKSPSTTGAGTEGALTKGPFNMLSPTTDLNNALLSYIITGYQGFSSAAGHVGTENRFDHDVSLLIPELWCRLSEDSRDPKHLIEEGSLEKMNDFEYNGEKIHASRLGYRITEGFLFRYLNRIFDEPQNVFNERMLKPEIQDMEAFADGIKNIVEAQEKVAINYFKDDSISAAIPPLQVLLSIMAFGQYDGKEISDPELRKMFDRDVVINSDWYKARLKRKQDIDIQYFVKQIDYLNNFMADKNNSEWNETMDLEDRLAKAKSELEHVKTEAYLESLVGTIGADPLFKK
ncbi:hypothetical protein DWB61_05750 [Ancylomarina euxinus]|uniref:PPi-type phosphoenolpyruvate carboxykinase lobe 2 domain-containing protein n=1 Tax=Ancylomarina euxinus TaxID=2283627 RepID=A0A425Y3Y4_9BACT|nr:hypothetical protein [Ancylomarina euxinus]MCZ4694541.1 hypothetical protein [Ancylomarina euxinus]MUP14084.1 hypothetical protein [Ancylomarina euxinus]RRG22942.1 hypothetical protein DWB61_05750 [Ancylomarina euxinus]